MMKIFFLRQEIGTDIETYNIYSKLLIIFINRLIEDNNFNDHLIIRLNLGQYDIKFMLEKVNRTIKDGDGLFLRTWPPIDFVP